MIPHSRLAAYCSVVYGLADSQLFTVHEVDCLVIRRGEYLVLAFRGTEASTAWPFEWSWKGLSNTRDIIRDLRFIPWRDPEHGVWMHKGFGISARWWVDEFVDRLPRKRKLIICGHSLGAGVAPHVARTLKRKGFDVVETVLFGEPKGHYWRSRGDYERLGILTKSYRTERDWIRLAGIGRLTAEPTILSLGDDCSPVESHHIERYFSALKTFEVNSYAFK